MAEAAAAAPLDAPSRKEIKRILARHARVANERLGYIHDALSWEQSEFLTLLPLLLHFNHPALPGFQGDEVPAGIAGYEPDRNALLSVRQYVHSLKQERRAQRYWPILGLYLIGSSGTLGQDRNSDFDIWVCHHPQLSVDQLAALEKKTHALEATAASRGLEVHFFILHADGFRKQQHNALSDESSGNTQHHLLLEEFYRTGLLLAGRPPLWWIVPLQQQQAYRAYCKELVGKRFVQENDWLDFGGLNEISASEFFSAAHWQLFKGIHVPYKSLLKLLLFESFAHEFPRVRWVAEEANALYQGQEELTAVDVDPYLLMMQRIEQYLQQKGDPARLELARRAFYIKSGVRLGRTRENWKSPLFRRLCQEWGWDEGELINLDQVNEWKLARVIDERDRLVGELTHSYRLLTTFAREQDKLHQIDMRELSLLGRKLYSALERRPGKIDAVNPGISANIRQDEVWLRRHPDSQVWQCFLSPPEESEPIKTTASIVELLTWLSANGAIVHGTRFDLAPEEPAFQTQEHLHILKALRQYFPAIRSKAASIEAFSKAPSGRKALAVINAMQTVAQLGNGLLQVSERGDPFSFGIRRRNLVMQVDYVHANNWGELHVAHHAGESSVLDMLCHHLELFVDQVEPRPLACYCDTLGYGTTIARRVNALAHRVLKHFSRHGDKARFIVQLAEEFHVITNLRGEYGHQPLGNRDDLLDYLGDVDDTFHPTNIDAAGMEASPLPTVVRLNRQGKTQVCYHLDSRGIHAFMLDARGGISEQFLLNGGEAHFLIQLERFFATVKEWLGPLGDSDEELQAEYIRLERGEQEWKALRVRPPRETSHHYTDLILSTGPKGPWRDGFSLISGSREFNSVALGNRIYAEVASYLGSLRRGDKHYPFYLTGVLTGGLPVDTSLSIAELIRIKVRMEQRLNHIAQSHRR